MLSSASYPRGKGDIDTSEESSLGRKERECCWLLIARRLGGCGYCLCSCEMLRLDSSVGLCLTSLEIPILTEDLKAPGKCWMSVHCQKILGAFKLTSLENKARTKMLSLR